MFLRKLIYSTNDVNYFSSDQWNKYIPIGKHILYKKSIRCFFNRKLVPQSHINVVHFFTTFLKMLLSRRNRKRLHAIPVLLFIYDDADCQR
jgi:hypothetical protein